MTAPRRYAIVGTGHRAELYFDALRGEHADVGTVVALCDTNPTRMAYYVERWTDGRDDAVAPTRYDAQEFPTLLERERPDAVIVTSPDATHEGYITQALAAGCDVVTEKPLTTTAEACARIVEAAERSDGNLTLTFNYRYAPRNSAVRQMVRDGAIGTVTSVHFEWLLDTVHGADFFRRWHREKATSGGLLVHKSTHHFDLVNWWLDAVPDTVTAAGGLRFYGAANARARGVRARPERSHGAPDLATDPFGLDLAADERLKRLYLDAEAADGYVRDRDVFSDGITIEDNIGALVTYGDGAVLTYSLNAHAPWEGYRVALNGTAGRVELDVVERAFVEASSASSVVSWRRSRATVDPSAVAGSDPAPDAGDAVRREGTRLFLQRHWERARLIDVAEGGGGHGGADDALLGDVFRGDEPDPLGRRAGVADGVRSVLVGVAANRSLASGGPVRLADLGVPLHRRGAA